jgi:hypothetical protein
MNDAQAKFRELLIESVYKHYEVYNLPENVPILLSGGVDSTTMLFAMLEAGKRPPCYTFQLGNRENNDTRAAKKLAKHFGLDWHLIKMPDDEHTLICDVQDILTYIPPRKVYVQATHPMLYVGPTLMADEHRYVFGAVCADAMYGSSQQMQRLYRKEGEAVFNAARQINIDNVLMGDSTDYMLMTLQKWSVDYFDIMNYRALKNHIRTLKFEDFWQGSKKKLPIMAFEDYYKQGAFVRDPRPFQIETGIREWHDTLLKTKLNTKHRKEISALYRDMGAKNQP